MLCGSVVTVVGPDAPGGTNTACDDGIYECGINGFWNDGADNFGPPWHTTRVESTLKYPWGSGNAVEAQAEGIVVPDSKPPGISSNHTVMMTGWIKADYTEEYDFWIQYDDGTVITINGTTILNNPGHFWFNWMVPGDQPVQMTAGEWVEIVILHSNYGGTSEFRLWWESDSVSLQDIPAANFRYLPPS